MNKSKKGFTLSEVLITLAIIGVVAALTIPSLIYGTIDQRFRNFLKKDYSSLGHALSNQVNEHNKYTSDDSITNSNELAAYFKLNLNVLKDNGAGTLWLSDGSKVQFVYASGCPAFADATDFDPTTSCYVLVDVNGDKTPNRISTDTAITDIFVLGIGPKSVAPVIPNADITVDGTAGFADFNGNPIEIDGAPAGTIEAGNDAAIAAINE